MKPSTWPTGRPPGWMLLASENGPSVALHVSQIVCVEFTDSDATIQLRGGTRMTVFDADSSVILGAIATAVLETPPLRS